MTVNIAVHKVGKVGTGKMDTAIEALEVADNQLDHNFVCTKELTNLDNSYSGRRESDHIDFVRYMEDTLHDDGILGDYHVHLILYERTLDDLTPFSGKPGIGGAGFSNWAVGAYPSEDDHNWFVEDRKYLDSKYAFAFVNIATGGLPYPYTELVFKNTVIHEVTHTFNVFHHDGAINYFSGKYHASPMATWYVESGDCGTHWSNAQVNSLCFDGSGDLSACKHETDYSSCAISIANSWLDSYT